MIYQKPSILIVDDEEVVCDLLYRDLSERGYLCATAFDSDGAFTKLAAQDFDVVLLDIKLPGMSGIELYKRIQRTAGSLASRVIFITGDTIGADTRDFLSRTRAHYITKPLDIEQLKREINSNLC